MVEQARRRPFRQGRHPVNERQRWHRWRNLQGLQIAEAELDCGTSIIRAVLFVVEGRFLTLRMLAAGEKLEAGQNLQTAVETRHHPEDRRGTYADCTKSPHLTQ